MALLLHYTGQDYISRGLLNTELTPGSTSAIVGGCKTGNGFAFDGTVNSRLFTTMEESNNHSISFWLNFTKYTIPQRVFCHGNAGYRQIYCFINQSNQRNYIFFARDDANGTLQLFGSVYSTLLTQGVWNHIAYTYSNLVGKIYINGILKATYTYASIRSGSTNAVEIGGWGATNPLNGQICNLKIYNHVLSQKEINEDYKSLMLHYKLDKPITTQVFDHSGFNRHIQVIQNTTTNSTAEKRVYGGSLANNGGKSLYGSLNLSELNGINEISVAVRFRFISQDGYHCYFSNKTTVGGYGIFICKVGGTSRSFIIDMAGRNEFILPYDLVSGTWYDLVAVKSTTSVKLYINGSSIYAISNTNSISNMGQLYAAISRSIADNNIENFVVANGNVQDIRFYAKALTQADVTELYQTRQEIDNLANGYCYELVEGQSEVEMKANGQLYCDEVIENDDGTFSIEQNKTIKTKEIKEV
jgi:hypothetical protein